MFASDASSGAASDVLFDLVFLDADKRMYETYLGLLLSAPSMLRPGALIVVDNTLWKQTVVQYDDQVAECYAPFVVIYISVKTMHIFFAIPAHLSRTITPRTPQRPRQ